MAKIYLEILVRNQHRKVIAQNQRTIKINNGVELFAEIISEKFDLKHAMNHGDRINIDSEIKLEFV